MIADQVRGYARPRNRAANDSFSSPFLLAFSSARSLSISLVRMAAAHKRALPLIRCSRKRVASDALVFDRACAPPGVLEDALVVGDAPHLQCPTSHFKEGVRLVHAPAVVGESLWCVVKGPYNFMSRLVRHAELPHAAVALGDRNAVVPRIVTERGTGHYYLAFAHLCPEAVPRDALEHAVMRDDSPHGAIKVLDRAYQGVAQAAGVSLDSLELVSADIVRSLLVRFVLGVGDSHLGNILVAAPNAAGQYTRMAAVDACDCRGTMPATPVTKTADLLFSKSVNQRTCVRASEWARRDAVALLALLDGMVAANDEQRARIAMAREHFRAFA